MGILHNKFAILAFWFGIFSGLSLPLGALFGIWMRPSLRIVAGIMAFGAGALLAALTFELVSPAIERAGYWPLAIGCSLGCVIFVALNQLLNSKGAFLRKSATITSHLKVKKFHKVKNIIGKLSTVDIFLNMPPDEIQAIVPHVSERNFAPGTTIFRQGDIGDALYIIESGTVDVSRHDNKEQTTSKDVSIAQLGPGKTFGEMALLTGEPRVATIIAHNNVKTWMVHKEDFDHLIKTSPRLKESLEKLLEQRTQDTKLRETTEKLRAEQWQKDALRNIDAETLKPTSMDVREAVHEQSKSGNVGLAILLGTILDGIPESLVLGASMIGAAISMPLLGGIFLANLPESMSSAVVMKRQGGKTSKIIWMWIWLMIITGLCALIGNVSLAELPHTAFAILEGGAAGAMLAMIAQTMLPEAYEHGGFWTGVFTVLGFLAAIFIRTLQPEAGH